VLVVPFVPFVITTGIVFQIPKISYVGGKNYSAETHKEIDIQFHTFLISALELITMMLQYPLPVEESVRLDPRAVFDVAMKRKFSLLFPGT
jgi:hypothetical protein